MLKFLHLHGVGPAQHLGPIKFAPRLNFITGDNGLGKSFFLDIAWWTLTRTWARNVIAAPSLDSEASIEYGYTKTTAGDMSETSKFRRDTQNWPLKAGRPPIPGIVIYAGVDGSFSAWDPARNYWNDKTQTGAERPRSFDFSPSEVWDGLTGPRGVRYCNGLIHDWVLWQQGKDPAFFDLSTVLDALSPSDHEKLMPGSPIRIGLDVKDQPSLRMPYGQDVALIHASAAMRRVVALAYLLVWTWREHKLAAKITGTPPAREIIFLIDEIECHLHPRWQRQIVPALMQVMQALTKSNVPVQLILATHSPLVLASVEPFFDENQDAIFTLRLQGGQAVVEDEVWAKQGDVVNWLVSDAFGLRQARSVEAERAIEAAEAWMRGDFQILPSDLNTEKAIHIELIRTLPGSDHFWPRWIVRAEGAEAHHDSRTQSDS